MDIEYREKIMDRMLTRAETGLYFIDDFLYDHSAKDGAYFRSICLLLSYSFELVLKATVVLVSKCSTKKELEKELRNLNHDIIKISNKLNTNELNDIGIKSISAKISTNFIGYIAKTMDDKEISIENFTDIRYDFMSDSLRSLPEDIEFKMWVAETHNILKNIRRLKISS